MSASISRSPRARLRLSLTAAMAAAALMSLAACGSSDDDSSSADASASSAESGDAFPVTITGALGETTIDEAPERVVTLGWGAGDIAVALGVVPVGTERDDWGGDADGYEPWFREAVEKTDSELPELISNAPELDVEAIIALEPDLILAPQSGLDQAAFDQLSEFTNVVAYPEGPWITPIDDQITIAAQALGKSDQAQGLIDGINSTLSDAAAAHPEFEGVTFAYVAALDVGTLSVYVKGDPRVDTLVGMGLEMAPSTASLTAPEGQFAADFGLENADKLSDVDVLFTWFNSPEEQATSEAQPLFAGIPAVAGGAYVPMLDRQLGMAVSIGTPLSVPWAIDRYVPLIAEAVAKVG